MFGVKPTCPHCKHAINDTTSRCPHCKNTIPKKYLADFRSAENLFWIVFLAGFILFLIIPVVLSEYLGGALTIIVILTGIPLSFAVGYFAKLRRMPKKPA